MNRDQKALVIDTLKNSFSDSNASFVVQYKGLTVKQLQTLRKQLRVSNGSFKVAKGRLIKLAVQDVDGITNLAPFFKEQVGVVFAMKEAPAVAKVLFDFSKSNEALRLIVGYFDDRVVASDAIERIALLPSKEVLLSQLCGTLQAPISGFARVLNMQIIRLLWTLKQVGEKKQ